MQGRRRERVWKEVVELEHVKKRRRALRRPGPSGPSQQSGNKKTSEKTSGRDSSLVALVLLLHTIQIFY